MILLKIIKKIQECIQKHPDITYRIINNTTGKNLILLSHQNDDLMSQLQTLFNKYIQEIIVETNEDKFLVDEIKSICEENQIVHRNISYIKWNRKSQAKSFDNVVAGYSFKGGMGRSSTIAYLSYFCNFRFYLHSNMLSLLFKFLLYY